MRRAVLCLAAVALLSCGTQSNDEPKAQGAPDPAGKGDRIREVVDPQSPKHKKNKDTVSVSGAAVVVVDTFDETQNGKSTGTIYVQDVGSKAPFSGISLFAPTFIPGNLRVGPGDVLSMSGQYQENVNISTAVFPPGALLAQIAQPTATFMYETTPPQPTETNPDGTPITPGDLSDWNKGRRWIGMLVRVKNVRLRGDLSRAIQSSGRVAVDFDDAPAGFKNACDAPFPRPPSLTNELFDLGKLVTDLAGDPAFKQDPTFKSVTGVVTFFCNLHLSPRSAADIER